MINSFLSYRGYPLVLIIISMLMMGGVYYFEYGLGLLPCQLCLYQRIPWWLIMAFGCFAFWFRHHRGVVHISLIGCGLLLFTSTLLAGHHVGVEWQWWQGPTSCSSGTNFDELDLNALKEALMQAPVISCDKIPWSLLGISMAGYNFLISCALTILTGFIIYRPR